MDSIADDVILVHTMGRVGSSTLQATIQNQLGRPVPHIHALNPETLVRQVARAGSLARSSASVQAGVDAVRQIMRATGRIKVITAVREPVDRNLSAMFAALTNGRGSSEVEAALKDSAAVRRAWEAAHHDRPHVWFDREVLEPLGVDIYKYQFPDNGLQTIRGDRVDILVVRAEVDNGRKLEAASRFLGFDSLPVVTRNDAARHGEMAELYRRWRAIVGPTEEYIAHHRNSRFGKHFYGGLLEVASPRTSQRGQGPAV